MILVFSTNVFASTPPPNIPLNVKTILSTTGSYSISWGSASGATYYKFWEKFDGRWSLINGNVRSTSYRVSGRQTGRYAYVVYACNAHGCSSGLLAERAIVERNPKTPTVTTSWQQSPIDYDTTATLSWRSTDANACKLDGVSVGTSGSKNYTLTRSTSKTVTCTNQWGKSGSDTSHIGVKPSTIPRNVKEFTSETGSYTVTWGAAKGATYYDLYEKADGGEWSRIAQKLPTSQLSDEVNDRPSGRYVYVVHACNTHGCAGLLTAKVVVDLDSQPPSVELNWSSSQVKPRSFATLSWSSSNADYCTLDGDGVEVIGTKVYKITQKTTKILSCTNGSKTTTKSATIDLIGSVVAVPDKSFLAFVGMKYNKSEVLRSWCSTPGVSLGNCKPDNIKREYGCQDVEVLGTDTINNRLQNVTDFVILLTGNSCLKDSVGYHVGHYDVYLDYVIPALKAIAQATDKDKKVWISTPPVRGSYPENWQIKDFLNQLRTKVIEELGTTFWSTRVSGMYMYEEDFDTDYVIKGGKDEYESYSLGIKYAWNLRDAIDLEYNEILEEAISQSKLSGYVHKDWETNEKYHSNEYKGLRFAPYFNSRYRTILYQLSKRHGVVFDKVNIQPNVVLARMLDNDKEHSESNFYEIKQYVEDQEIVSSTLRDFIPVKQYGKVTQIGVDMELDNAFDLTSVDEDKKKHQRDSYKEQVEVFQNFVGNRSILFYIGHSDWYIKTPALLDCVNDFYNESTKLDSNASSAKCLEAWE